MPSKKKEQKKSLRRDRNFGRKGDSLQRRGVGSQILSGCKVENSVGRNGSREAGQGSDWYQTGKL